MQDNECPNPQLLAWVREWLDLARERNSKGVTTYKHAYESLKACPIAFQHPTELQQLKGFGPKLCDRLTDLLRKHCEENGLPMPQHPQARRAAQRDQEDNGASSRSSNRAKKPKAYVPAFRSGAYALILALSTLDEQTSQGMAKAELIDIAQPHSDSSFTAPTDPAKFYTAWNSMKTLMTKELVFERGRPLRKYALTDEGWEVAKRIKETAQYQGENEAEAASTSRSRPPVLGPADDIIGDEDRPTLLTSQQARPSTSSYQNVVADGPAVSENADLPSFTPIRLSPGSFSVQLVLDVREVRAKTDRDYMQEELTKQGVRPIMKSLELGDAQWIAKVKDSELLARHGAEGDEVVLDWIVERKRLDDLIFSIKDGRFHEQKFRLKRSGIKKVVYIIEEFSIDPAMFQKYEESVRSAIASTQVVNGYFVKRTSKMDDTIKYLARMTKMLKQTYEGRTLHVIPTSVITAQNYLPLLQHLRNKEPSEGCYISYAAFASMASKSESITLRDVFLKMLMTTRGVTGERALELQKRWKTPWEFVTAYKACGIGEEGRKRKHNLVLNNTSGLIGRKKFSKQLSQKISEIWGDA